SAPRFLEAGHQVRGALDLNAAIEVPQFVALRIERHPKSVLPGERGEALAPLDRHHVGTGEEILEPQVRKAREVEAVEVEVMERPRARVRQVEGERRTPRNRGASETAREAANEARLSRA